MTRTKTNKIAKIESCSGVDNIDEICQYCNGIMIVRSNIDVEIPFVEVPIIQTILISKYRMLRKRVITATETFKSIIYNLRPIRIELQ